MLGKKIKNIMLLLIASVLCLIATGLHANGIKTDCLEAFSTDPGEKHPLSDEKSRIVYQSRPGGWGSGIVGDIFSVRPDGTDVIQHTNNDDGLPYKYYPEFSPDGTMLAFEACSDTSCDIIIADATSELTYPDNVIKTLDSGCYDGAPSFSPDNQKLAAVRECSGSSEIVIFTIGDGTWSSLGNFGLELVSAPKFSPDGTKIVFSAYDTEYPIVTTKDIYLINSDGTNLLNLTDSETEYDYNPCWSPDGQYIVYAMYENDSDYGELHIMYNDGTYIQPLTAFYSTAFHHPSFSPDGEKLVFDLYYYDDTYVYYDGMYIMGIYEEYFDQLKDPVWYEGYTSWSLEFEPPGVDVLLAYPRYIESGSSTTIFWETSNTYSCKIENDVGEDVGSVDVNGYIDVTPTDTTIYTLKAYGLAGSVVSQKIKIVVE